MYAIIWVSIQRWWENCKRKIYQLHPLYVQSHFHFSPMCMFVSWKTRPDELRVTSGSYPSCCKTSLPPRRNNSPPSRHPTSPLPVYTWTPRLLLLVLSLSSDRRTAFDRSVTHTLPWTSWLRRSRLAALEIGCCGGPATDWTRWTNRRSLVGHGWSSLRIHRTCSKWGRMVCLWNKGVWSSSRRAPDFESSCSGLVWHYHGTLGISTPDRNRSGRRRKLLHGRPRTCPPTCVLRSSPCHLLWWVDTWHAKIQRGEFVLLLLE